MYKSLKVTPTHTRKESCINTGRCFSTIKGFYIRSTLDHSPSYYLTGSSSDSPPVFVTDNPVSIGDDSQVLDDKNNNTDYNGSHQERISNKRRKSHHHQQQQIHAPASHTGVTTATSNQSMFIPDPLRSCVIETDVSSYLQAPSSGQVHLIY